MWAEFVVGYHPCSERFFSKYSSFPPSTKTNISKFNPETVDKDSLCGCAATKFPFILFYLFYEPNKCLGESLATKTMWRENAFLTLKKWTTCHAPKHSRFNQSVKGLINNSMNAQLSYLIRSSSNNSAASPARTLTGSRSALSGMAGGDGVTKCSLSEISAEK